MIEAQHLRKRFGTRWVVNDVSFHVKRGHCLVLLGASGSGKTTTMKLINRLLEPDDGEVWVNGHNVMDQPAHLLRREIGYVFQQVGLFPNMTVSRNIGVTPRLLGWSKERIDARVAELLKLVELPVRSLWNRFPHELSGGQAQRVGVARALAAKPELMLLDEPFGALDPLTRRSLQRFFRKLQRTMELTSIFVTHDIFEALYLADWIVVMDQGKVVQQGTPRVLLQRPATDAVAELMSMPTEHAAYVDALLEAARTGSSIPPNPLVPLDG